MAAKGTGSDGSGYELARQFGHRIIKPLPALVQLKCEGNLLPKASGVRTDCLVEIRTGDGKTAAKDRGELQITDYGISGHPGIPGEQVCGEAFGSEAEGVCSPELSAGSG